MEVQTPPNELYKYIRFSENLYKTLINIELWFSSPNLFNDPFDCQLKDSTDWDNTLAKEQFLALLYRYYIKKKPNTNFDTFKIQANNTGITNKQISEIILGEISSIGVSCFSVTFENLLMWSHYADSHKGICLKFDTNFDKEFFSGSRWIEYSENYPVIDFGKNNFKEEIRNLIFVKSDNWSYEKEIRVFKEKPGLYKFKKECLKEIIFGCKVETKNIDAISSLVLSIYPNISLKQAKLKLSEYGLDFVDITPKYKQIK